MAEPVLARADLVRDQVAHPPFGARRGPDAPAPVRVGITGTGDDLLILAWSEAALARERAAGARVFGALGIVPGMRVANTLPGALATPGALLVGDVNEEIGALDVPLGVPDGATAARQAWELFDRVEATVLIVEPSTAAGFFAAAPATARPWWRGIVWLVTDPSCAYVPPPADFDGWQRSWFAVPEATSFVAHSCTAGRFHVDAGVIVEVVDGVVALTPRDVDAPLARYASGLRGRLAPCGCGAGVALEVA